MIGMWSMINDSIPWLVMLMTIWMRPILDMSTITIRMIWMMINMCSSIMRLRISVMVIMMDWTMVIVMNSSVMMIMMMSMRSMIPVISVEIVGWSLKLILIEVMIFHIFTSY